MRTGRVDCAAEGQAVSLRCSGPRRKLTSAFAPAPRVTERAIGSGLSLRIAVAGSAAGGVAQRPGGVETAVFLGGQATRYFESH